MEINQSNLSALFTGFNTTFTQAFGNVQPTYEMVASVEPSSTAQNIYAWLGNSTSFREWIGDRQFQNLQAHNYTLVNKPYESSQEVDREVIEDDQYGVYSKAIAMMGENAKVHPDTLIYPGLAYGFTGLCYDGQPFFSSNHLVGNGLGGTTYLSNIVPGSGNPAWYLLCTKKIVKPMIWQLRKPYEFTALFAPSDPNVFLRKKFQYGAYGRGRAGYGLWQLAIGSQAALTPANYELAITMMKSMTNDNGVPMNVIPDLLVVPPALEATAKRVIKMNFQFYPSLSGGTEFGGDNPNVGTAELLVSPYLNMAYTG